MLFLYSAPTKVRMEIEFKSCLLHHRIKRPPPILDIVCLTLDPLSMLSPHKWTTQYITFVTNYNGFYVTSVGGVGSR